ncbi:hypothetical protein [Thalassomonas actiniarum]|uniref:Metallo-beta-lactamase domain-containing protein n=1 Tax=Thalassomonas actiniarum TaxID=485447 RepID=A0AAF0C374_9GAMM|nr:hypothetical protein [Thalassomonas actiniarum]WDD98635.1 hypothetical protein SG35_025865 [Thalassomonas actiniarum]
MNSKKNISLWIKGAGGRFSRLFYIAVLALTCFGASAQQPVEQLIDKTIKAYGNEKLLALDTLKLIESYQEFDYGQSVSPQEVDLAPGVFELSVDFKSRQKNFQWVRGDKEHFSTRHWLYDGRRGYQIGHASKSLAVSEGSTFSGLDRDFGLVLDTLVVKLLAENRDSAAWFDAPVLSGQAVSFKAGEDKVFTLYIDEQTGYVMHMTRPGWQPGQSIIYHFSNHRQQQGLVYASDTYMTDAGEPSYVTRSRKVEFNPALEKAFALPEGYSEQAKSLSYPDMVVKKLAENVYLAGKSWGFSVFIDAGEYFIVAGGYKGLTERYQAVKDFSETDKPVKYQIVSHHHNDHLKGMEEAARLGANFVTAAAHIASIREAVPVPLADERFVPYQDFTRLAPGLVKVFDFPNSHATHNLLTYIPAAKLLFSADLYFSRQQTGAPGGYDELKRLSELLAAQGAKVSQYAAAHSPRILTGQDFNTSLQTIVKPECPKNWLSCQIILAR